MIDCHNHIGVELGAYLRNEFPYCQDLEMLVTQGEPLGVRKWIVFPMVSNLCMDFGELRKGRIRLDQSLETVPYAFENRRLLHEIAELFPHFRDRVYPFVIVDPVREVAGQVKSLRELRAKYGFCGLKLQTEMIHVPLKGLLREGKPLLDLAIEWNLSVLIHTSVRPDDPYARAADACDIAETYPEIRFCLAHSCRFDREVLDRIRTLPNTWFDCSAHRIHCVLAVEDSRLVAPAGRRFHSDYTDPRRVLHDLAAAYPEKLMWGSDSPYYSFIAVFEGESFVLKSTYREEAACLDGLEEELFQKVTNKNTLAFLGVEE